MMPFRPTRLMHGTDWSGEDVAGWWLSEKLNGWRCVWTGTEFLSRQGEVFAVPSWYKDGMEPQLLDGELWAGPGTSHDQVNGAVRSGNWRALTFRPFDVPVPGLRIEAAQAILGSLVFRGHVRPVNYMRVASTAAAIRTMMRIVAAGGEGVMLRKPGSAYWPDCRSVKLLKLVPGALARIPAPDAPPDAPRCPMASFDCPPRALDRGACYKWAAKQRIPASRIRLDAPLRPAPG